MLYVIEIRKYKWGATHKHMYSVEGGAELITDRTTVKFEMPHGTLEVRYFTQEQAADMFFAKKEKKG